MATRTLAEIQQAADIALQQKQQMNQLALQQAQALNDISQQGAQSKQQQALMAALGGDGSGALATKSSGNPMIDAFQQYQNQESATNPWNIGARAIRQTALPHSDNLWENLLGAGAQGLGTGILSQLGENYTNSSFQQDLMPTLSKLYPSMTDALGTTPNISSGKMALIAALTDEAHQNKLDELGIKNNKGRQVSSALALSGLDSTGSKGDDLFGLIGSEKRSDKMNKIAAKKIDMGVATPATVGGQIKEEFAGDIAASKELSKLGIKEGVQAQKMNEVLDRVDPAIDASEKLIGPGLDKKAERLAANYLPDAINPYSTERDALQQLKSVRADIIASARTVGTGSVSDYEDKIYLSAAPTEDNSPAAARMIADQLRNITKFKQEKAALAQYMISEGASPSDVDQAWDVISKKAPKFIKVDGEMIVNPNRPSIYDIIKADKQGNLSGLLSGSGLQVPTQQQTLSALGGGGGLPEGAVDTGRTSKGRPVYKLPNGQLVRG